MRFPLGWIVVLSGGAVSLASPCETVEIVRDTWGIPHVFAATDEGAMYGAGYAAAQDRLYQMHRWRMAAQGRLAELEGLRNGPDGTTTVTQDTYFRKLRFYPNVRTIADNLPAETQNLLRAYSAGVTQYIHDHPTGLSPLFHGETPVDWTVADCLAVWNFATVPFSAGIPGEESTAWHSLQAAGSCEAYLATHPLHKVIDESAAVMQESETPLALHQAICDFAASMGYPCGGGLSTPWPQVTDKEYPKFSHAWVVGGSALQGGSTALVSMPQTKIWSPALWYESHLKGATFDARGFGFAGCPGFLIGFSRDVAWGATALGIDLSDTFLLSAGPDGQHYLYDGQLKPIFSEPQAIKVRQPSGTFTTVNITVSWTELGPVVTEYMDDPRPGERYILRALPLVDDHEHTVQAMFGMMRARDAAEFRGAAALWRSPSIHSVHGDKTGAIGYYSMAAIPVRSPQSHCLLGTATQDGTSSLFAWKGFIPGDVKPQVAKPAGGALFSGNHIPVGGWYPIPLHLGTGGSGDGGRSWRLRERLDLTVKPVFTDTEVFDVRTEVTNPTLREIVRAGLFLRDHPPAPPLPQFTAATLSNLAVLQAWHQAGAKSLVTETHWAGAYWMDLRFRYVESSPWKALVGLWGGNNLPHMLKNFKARLDAFDASGAPPNFTEDEIEFLNNAIGAGYATANAKYGGSPAGWKTGITNELGHSPVPYFGTLEGFGSLNPFFDADYTGFVAPDIESIRSQLGASAILTANLKVPDRSRASLGVGESEDPASLFFDDQAGLWVASDLRSAPLGKTVVDSIKTSSAMVCFTASCAADLNGDGLVDFGDYLEFLNLFDAGDQRVDFNGDGLVDFSDYLEFLNLFDAGCWGRAEVGGTSQGR